MPGVHLYGPGGVRNSELWDFIATLSAAAAVHTAAADPHTGYRLESAPIVTADLANEAVTAAKVAVGTYVQKFDVTKYGADRLGVSASGPGILAAVAAATAAPHGGVVWFPAGNYLYNLTTNGPIILPQRVNNCVHLEGEGDYTSCIQFSGDTGANTFAIRASVKTGGTYSEIRRLRLVGPGATVLWGTAPCAVSAVEVSAGMRLERVSATAWYAGARIIGDHIGIIDCRLAGGNYCGLHFADMQTQGDLTSINNDLSGATFASVLMSTGSYLAGSVFIQGHMGFTPYGIYAEAGAILLGGVEFINTSWEILGHGAIVSADRLLQMDSVHFHGCGPFNSGGGQIGLRTDYIVFDVGVSNNVTMNGCTPDSLASPAGPPFKFAALSNSNFDGIPLQLLLAARTAGVRIFDAGNVSDVRVRADGADTRLVMSPLGGAFPTRGQVLARRPNGFCEAVGINPGLPAFGVAAENAVANGKSMMVAVGGHVPVLASNAAADFTRLVVDSATSGSAKAEAMTAFPSAQVLGTVRTATAAAGLVLTDLAIAPDPFRTLSSQTTKTDSLVAGAATVATPFLTATHQPKAAHLLVTAAGFGVPTGGNVTIDLEVGGASYPIIVLAYGVPFSRTVRIPNIGTSLVTANLRYKMNAGSFYCRAAPADVATAEWASITFEDAAA